MNEGGVYAILEPEVQQERRATGNGFILVVNKPEHFLLIGRSKDFVPCRATNKVRAALALAIGLRTASARLVSEAAVCVCVFARALVLVLAGGRPAVPELCRPAADGHVPVPQGCRLRRAEDGADGAEQRGIGAAAARPPVGYAVDRWIDSVIQCHRTSSPICAHSAIGCSDVTHARQACSRQLDGRREDQVAFRAGRIGRAAAQTRFDGVFCLPSLPCSSGYNDINCGLLVVAGGGNCAAGLKQLKEAGWQGRPGERQVRASECTAGASHARHARPLAITCIRTRTRTPG